MTLSEKDILDPVLRRGLICASLPTDPKLIIGRHYQFCYQHKPRYILLIGTILAIEFLPEIDQLRLYITNPQCHDRKIVALVYKDNYDSGWGVLVEFPSELEFMRGEFKLL